MSTSLNIKNNKKVDFLLLVFLPIFAAIISLLIKANFLTSTILFFGLPAVWLSYRARTAIKKAFLFSLVLSVPLATIIDYIATVDGAWFVPESVFPFRFLEIVPIEDCIWGFLSVYLIVLFYEHFLDKGRNKLVGKEMKLLAIIILTAMTLFLALFMAKPALLNMQYAYFWLGTIFLAIPTIFFFLIFLN